MTHGSTETEHTAQTVARSAITRLAALFREDPTAFSGGADLSSQLATLLAEHPAFTFHTPNGPVSLVHQEYPTAFKCQMGDLRFEVLEDHARARRGHYDLVVLNPWWVERVSPETSATENFTLFRREIRDRAQPGDPPLCLVGIEFHLVRTERPRLADYSRIGRDYRKLLLSGTLQNDWRFMDHRYMLVFSQHSQPHEAKWRRLVEAGWERDVDPKNVWLFWTSPQGTRTSG
jgi:hypothetical protein